MINMVFGLQLLFNKYEFNIYDNYRYLYYIVLWCWINCDIFLAVFLFIRFFVDLEVSFFFVV